jgi:hypothetical protein
MVLVVGEKVREIGQEVVSVFGPLAPSQIRRWIQFVSNLLELRDFFHFVNFGR